MKKALIRFAKEDLKAAKKEGRMSIGGTRVGCLEVEYQNGLFHLVAREGMETREIGKLSFQQAAETIADLYEVVRS